MEKKRHQPKSVEEDLQGIYERELLEETKQKMHPKVKKALILGIGIFCVLLMLSFLYLEFPLFGILWGQMESRPLQGNTITAGNITVTFDTPTINKIRDYYTANQKTEISLCLIGENQGTTYYINDVYKPNTFSQEFNRVVHEPCNASTLIDFHTHPYKSCIASDVDLENLRRNKLNNPAALMLIMCEPSRFSVYG
jgi:proteasome lid subunit RPN8/RPN11